MAAFASLKSSHPENEIRMVLIGKTGVGKSKTGNSILGDKKNSFSYGCDSKSVTFCGLCKSAVRFGRILVVVDTPGVCDTERANFEVQKEITRCISLKYPGPHALLFCVKMGRFTNEDRNTIKHFLKYFGEEILKYTIVVFTHFDQWQEDSEELHKEIVAIEQYINDLPQFLKDFVALCSNRYVFVNNRLKGRKQEDMVRKIIEKIDSLILTNNNKCYTNADYQMAEKNLEEDTRRSKKSRDEVKTGIMAAYAPCKSLPPGNEIRMVLIGKTGVGKSKTGNSILGVKENAFYYGCDPNPVEFNCRWKSAKRFGRTLDIVDTPELFDTEKANFEVQKEIIKCIALTTPGPHALLFCVKMGRFTKEDRDTIKQFLKYFGEEILKYTIVVFTHFDQWQEDSEEKNKWIVSAEQYIKDLPQLLKEFVLHCGNRHVFVNNRLKGHKQEEMVRNIIEKIETLILTNSNKCYTNADYRMVEQTLEEETRRSKKSKDELKTGKMAAFAVCKSSTPGNELSSTPGNELRMVLIGKTGVGKSKTGNSILGDKENAFYYGCDPNPVTCNCRWTSSKRFGRKLDIVDTPELFDTEKANFEVQKEIIKCIALTSPGPHAFLFCVKMGRFTKEDRDTIKQILKYFGEEILKYTIVVFTHLDQWQEDSEEQNKWIVSAEQYIKDLPQLLKDFVAHCGNRYVFVNNRLKGRKQEDMVKEIIDKIETLILINNNKCYTNTDYEMAEKALEEETKKSKKSRDEVKTNSLFHTVLSQVKRLF